MKILGLLYYAMQWLIWIVALITWTNSDLPIKNMTAKVIILVLMAIYLSWIGYRDFIKAIKK
jgi:hypothetical protein